MAQEEAVLVDIYRLEALESDLKLTAMGDNSGVVDIGSHSNPGSGRRKLLAKTQDGSLHEKSQKKVSHKSQAELTAKEARTTSENKQKGKSKPTNKPPSTDRDAGSNSEEENFTCHICKLDFCDDDGKLIGCGRCPLWFCIGCIDMNEAVYELFARNNNGSHWYCSGCNEAVLK